jgi:hypothetical protein
MVKRGGSAAEAKTLADEFQGRLLDVMFERKDVNDENDIIKAKALTGTKKKEPAKLPSDFVTNDDFCPACGLELKSLPIERQNLWTDAFQRDLQDGFDPVQQMDRVKPGLLSFRGWGLERQLAADRRRYIDLLRQDIAALRQAQPPHFPFVHGVGDAESPVNLRISRRGNCDAGVRESDLEGAFRHRAGRHAEQLRRDRRASHASRASRLPRAVLHRPRPVREEAAPRDHAERGLPAERRS